METGMFFFAGMMKNAIVDILFVTFVILCVSFTKCNAINCYTCNSYNGTDKNCTDPFHPAYSIYQKQCMVPKKNHIGLFPANFCIKIIGTSTETNVEVVIRACTLQNMDNQCGVFRYQDQYYNGCILTCTYDGCNSSRPSSKTSFSIFISVLFVFILNRILTDARVVDDVSVK
ncbi:Uncharacterised protein g9200 [Pycnogonum litorale]